MEHLEQQNTHDQLGLRKDKEICTHMFVTIFNNISKYCSCEIA